MPSYSYLTRLVNMLLYVLIVLMRKYAYICSTCTFLSLKLLPTYPPDVGGIKGVDFELVQ